MPLSVLQQLEYTVRSYPLPVFVDPSGCETDPRMWKNWLIAADSVVLQRELNFMNAARTNLEVEEKSPGKPNAPIPRL